MEYIIYCDESDSEGKYFSNFYGGLLVKSTDLLEVTSILNDKKKELGLEKELKWQRVTSNYLDKYVDFIDTFLDFVRDDKVKVRVMFTQNINVPPDYEKYKKDNKYFLLYYQFIKHAFGLAYSEGAKVRLYLDKLPDTKEKVESFKGHILALNKNPKFRQNQISFDKEQVAEIDSREHILAQSLDIVLGSMQFRLNDKHQEKPEGCRVRGKRTIAKEKLYKHINCRVRAIYPNFNIGRTTGIRGDTRCYWSDPYRHWLFKPSGSEVNLTLAKKKQSPAFTKS